MIPDYPMIITAEDPAWTDGFERLFEPLEEDETFYVYSVLYIAARTDVQHGIISYYPLLSTIVEEARRTGMIPTNAEGTCVALNIPRQAPIAPWVRLSAKYNLHYRQLKSSPIR